MRRSSRAMTIPRNLVTSLSQTLLRRRSGPQVLGCERLWWVVRAAVVAPPSPQSRATRYCPASRSESAAVYASKIEVVFEFTWEPSRVGQVPAQSGPTQHVVHYGQRVLTWHPARGHQPGHRNHGAALPHIVLEKFDEADGLWPAIAVDDDRRSAGRGLWNGSSQNAGPGSWGKHRIGSTMQQFGWQDSGRRRQNRQHELHEQHIQAVVRSVSPDSAVYGIKERGSIGVDQQPRHLLLHEVLAPATRQFRGTARPVLYSGRAWIPGAVWS